VSAGRKVRTIVAQVEGTPFPPEPTQGPGDRKIPKGHEFDARSLKPLSRALFSASVALGHSVAAYKEFARVKSSSVSPDGMLGGRGYVMSVKDVRAQLQQACETLSAITDTLFDEITAPHWKPKMAELDDNESEDISELVGEASHAIEDPEAYGEKDIKEVESRNDKGDKGPASKLPETGGTDSSPAEPFAAGSGGPDAMKHASLIEDWKAPSAVSKHANSSLPVTTLPGPRVDHLDRGEQTGPGGSYNQDEDSVVGWGNGPREGDYTSVWADSAVPDSNSEPTETSAYDFGLGYGAKGEGIQDKGVPGPSSTTPGDPGRKVRDVSDGMNPYLDSYTRDFFGIAKLPDPGPPARSDYYQGDKGNQFNVNVADSELPGQNHSTFDYDRDTPNEGEVYERQDVPYLKFDWTTHNYRNDPQDLYQYDNKVETNG